jgi:hypothetical protein
LEKAVKRPKMKRRKARRAREPPRERLVADKLAIIYLLAGPVMGLGPPSSVCPGPGPVGFRKGKISPGG